MLEVPGYLNVNIIYPSVEDACKISLFHVMSTREYGSVIMAQQGYPHWGTAPCPLVPFFIGGLHLHPTKKVPSHKKICPPVNYPKIAHTDRFWVFPSSLPPLMGPPIGRPGRGDCPLILKICRDNPWPRCSIFIIKLIN